MNTLAARIIMILSIAICMATAGLFAYTEEINYLLLPVCFIAAVCLLLYPEMLFYVLMASIPWSVEFFFPEGLSTDLPDEPLMILAALSVIMIIICNRNKAKAKKIHPLSPAFIAMLPGLLLHWI